MDRQALINTVTKHQLKKSQADVRVGDTVKVHYRIREGNKERVQVFTGLVTATKAGQSSQAALPSVKSSPVSASSELFQFTRPGF